MSSVSTAYVLVEKVVESFRQALPGQVKQRKAEHLMKVQQSVPNAQHHGTRCAGQGHGGLVLL